MPFDTRLSPDEEAKFREWKQKYAPEDSGEDYDLRGAFKSGFSPDTRGHWPDTYKKPNHPTFSNESIYAPQAPEKAGRWQGETYLPPFDYSKPFTVPGQEVSLVPNLLPPASYKPDITDRIADSAERGYKFYRQSELINKPLTRETADEVARLQREIEEIPVNPAIEKVQRAQGLKEWASAIADDPIETISGLFAESLGSLIPKALKTVPAHMLVGAGAGLAIGGPAGAALGARAGFSTGTGVTSYSLEYAGKFLESLREAGVDIKDANQLETAFSNQQLMDEVKSKANLKGVPIAVVDAFSAGIAGKILSKPASSAIGRVGQLLAETGQQTGLAGFGELSGQVASGEKISLPSIANEMLLEPISAAPEIVTGTLTRKTRPLGERTINAPQERQEVIPVERAGTETQRTTTSPVPGNRVLPAAQVEPAPQEEIARQTGWTLSQAVQQGALTPEQVATLTPEQQAELSSLPSTKPSWEFTDPRTGTTAYVPQTATVEQGVEQIRNKPLAGTNLQGGRRSSQLERPLTEGPAPIPAAPPASTPAPSLWTQIDPSTEPQAISKPEIDRLVTEFQAAYPNAPRIVVAENKADLEVLTGQRFPQNDPAAAIVRSPVTGNAVFLVADHITSPDRLKALLAHEAIGHHGVESVMKDDFRALALAVEQKLRDTDQWRDISERYGGRGRTFGPDDQAVFGQELIARMAEGDIQDLSLWEQVVAFIRKWWRDHVSRTNPISDAEIRKALVDARKFLQGQGQSGQAETGTSFAEEPAKPEENPFDRMRRESGAEPPPELTPEQQAARDRNEKQRGMRPNPLTSFALEPVDQAAYENGDDVWVTHKIGGNPTTRVRDRIRITTETTIDAQKHAKAIFDELGIPVEWIEVIAANPVSGAPSRGYWKYIKQENFEAGRRLAARVHQELNGPQTDERALLLGSLINSVRYNRRLRNDVGVFDGPTQMDLAKATWHEASIRGAQLQELNQHPGTIDEIAMDAPMILERIWHDAFGGEVIDGVMAEIRKGTQAFITRPLIQHVLAQNPTLQGALDLVTVLNEDLKGLPDALALLEEVFRTPFYNLADFGKALEKRLIEQYKVDPKEAAKIAKEFQAAFDPSLKQAANEALKIAIRTLSYESKAKVKSKKSIEALVMEAINQGALESGEVLRRIAKDNHWNSPTDEQIDHMKRLSDRLVQLKNLKPADLAERKKMGATDQEIENARRDKVTKLGSEIARVRRDMETAWAKMTKPVSLIYGLPFIGQPEIRANTARAINEFIAANLLAKFGFGTRQFVAIFSQFVSFVPTRSIANALVDNAHAKNWQEKQPFYKAVAGHLRDGYKQQFGAIRPALAAAEAAFRGRGGGQQIGQLMSGLNALDRLTKQAEEQWTLGNQTLADGDILKAGGHFARSILLHFFSSVKLGYRIAQGLDRLQGIPAHYQNMRAQVVRALMDAGKTRLEADTSADLVIGDMNAQWMLATAAVRDEMLAEGIEVTPQKVRQNSWNLVKRWQYQRIQELGLPADAFEEESNFLENTIGWNKKEIKGLGGGAARFLRQAEKVAEGYGLPLVMTRFSNAIGITINRLLAHTPFWKQANVGGHGESAWFKSEVDRAQRRVEGYVGTAVGSVAILLAYSGVLVVRLKWPKDKEERDLFERQGHRPNTVEIPTGDNEFIPISLNNSPFMFVAPYLAAGAALREKVDDIAKKQAALDAHAAELGVTAERLPGPSIGDYALIGAAAAQQAILGGRTVSGLIGSVSTYGTVNAKKTAASYISALTPWLPGVQEVTRMGGVTLDERMATMGDFLLPLPTSQARKVNLLGDSVKTPGDIQRVAQILTGGSYPGVVDGNQAKEEAAYRALFESGYRPPSINPTQGYLIDGTIRPMKGLELQRYTEARGRNLKEALSGFAATGDPDQDKKAARDLYKSANDSALSEVGAASVPRYSSGSSTVKAPNAPRASRSRSRSARRLRSPRLRGGRIRRIRTRSSRRVRRIRSVRLAA